MAQARMEQEATAAILSPSEPSKAADISSEQVPGDVEEMRYLLKVIERAQDIEVDF